jgi:lipopolysaccharide export LptBFGC system permease protein LptF
MPILTSRVQRYLIVPLMANILVALFLFVLLWMAPEAFFNTVQAVQAGTIPFKTGILLLAYQLPEVLMFALPMACLMGSVFLIRRLNQDGEWLAFLTLGVPRYQLYAPLFLIGLVAMCSMAVVQNLILPGASSRKTALELQYGLEELNPVSALVPLYFGTEQENHRPLGLLLLGAVSSRETARDVLMLRFQPDRKDDVLSEWVEADYLAFINNTPTLGNAFRLKLDATGDVVLKSEQTPMLEKPELEGVQRLLPILARNIEHAPLNWLIQVRPVLKHFGQWQLLGALDNNLWDRIITPLSLPLLILIGIPIALEGPRQQSTRPFTLAALVLFIYLVSRPMATQLASTGAVPGILAALIPFTLLLGLFIYFMRRTSMR